jgi:hypothetical protein
MGNFTLLEKIILVIWVILIILFIHHRSHSQTPVFMSVEATAFEIFPVPAVSNEDLSNLLIQIHQLTTMVLTSNFTIETQMLPLLQLQRELSEDIYSLLESQENTNLLFQETFERLILSTQVQTQSLQAIQLWSLAVSAATLAIMFVLLFAVIWSRRV